MPSSSDPAVPDYLVIGAMKCGSSTVCGFLEDHPDTFMVPRLEPDFFARDEMWARGRGWYASLFEDAEPGQLRGEGSNRYIAGAAHPRVAERLHGHAPEAKLVLMVRHPIERIVSAWTQMRVDRGDGVPSTVDRAVRERHDSLVDPSLYWKNLAPFRERFPPERIFVGFMEDMAREPERFWRSLTDFLGVAPMMPRVPHRNPSDPKRVPTRAYSALNALPILRTLRRRLVPAELRAAAKRRLLSVPAREVRLGPETEARLRALIAPDARALLRHCGKPEDFWQI